MTTLAEAAVGYARAGWPVVPLWWPAGEGCACGTGSCASPGKHPLGRLVPHGLNEPSTNVEAVEAWWTAAEQANIGLRTGVAFDVLDVESLDALDALDARGDTVCGGPFVATGGGGFHAYFAPSGWGNRTRMDGLAIDWRGVGGYLVAPPSMHASGRAYWWLDGPDTPLEPPPLGVVTLVHPTPAPRRAPARTGPGEAPVWSAHGLVHRMATAVEGERNDVLNWAAHRLVCDVAAGRATSAEAYQALETLAEVAVGRRLGTVEVDRTIASALAGRTS